MELQYEHIDWSDIVDAELSGDQEALRMLRDKAAEIKLAKKHKENLPPSPVSQKETKREQQCPISRHRTRRPEDLTHNPPDTKIDGPELRVPAKLNHSVLENQQENILTLEGCTTSPPCSTTTFTYAEMVSRNPKRTLVDRCLSPSEVPLKRSATSDIMKTPTEFKTFYPASPSCDTTPETNSISVKAGLVQRRLFGIQTQEQAKPKSSGSQGEQLQDTHRLAQRQKQIDFGKNTIGYERYIQTVPKWKRQKADPSTPDKYNACSTRSWQGQIRVWRRQLHKYDPCDTASQQHFTVHDAALCNINMDGQH